MGGTIDNSKLDKAITEDLTPQQYVLVQVDKSHFAKHTRGHKHGTIIHFEGLKDGVKRSFEFLRKMIASYFRFSLLDKNFNIFLNDTKVTHKDLKALSEKTEFLWKFNSYDDPFVAGLEEAFAKEADKHELKEYITQGCDGIPRG